MAKPMKSKAFQAGLIRGFSSPFSFFYSKPLKFSYRHSDTVSRSWHVVGRELDIAIAKEAKVIEQIPQLKKARRASH